MGQFPPHASDEISWPVPRRTAEREIGAERAAELDRLAQWLYDRPNCPFRREDIVFRTAPSVIARSEVELFGASMPRFAYRAYLGPDCFVNARRIELLRKTVRGWSKRRPKGPKWKWLSEDICQDDRVPPPPELLLDVRRSSCIGDSVLRPPNRLVENGYHVSTTELGLAYGEHCEIRGTPYIRSIRVGGGWCAQANCLMATLLLQEYTEGIHGVAEITHIAASQENECFNEIDLGGMGPRGIVRYFQGVGLRASEQVVEMPGEDETYRALGRFSSALNAYATSNMPVILPLDSGRMCGIGDVRGENIFWRNTHAMRAAEVERRRHAVLVVGCHRRKPYEFLLNDPATLPFLQASASQILEARNYGSGERLCRENMVRRLSLITVAPKQASMPLLDIMLPAGPDGTPRRQFGLIHVSTMIQSAMARAGLAGQGTPEVLGTFRLLHLGWQQADYTRFVTVTQEFPPDCMDLLWRAMRVRSLPACWCWCQYREDLREVWLWDATQEPASGRTSLVEQKERLLLGVIRRDERGWRLEAARNSQESIDSIRPRAEWASERLPKEKRSWRDELSGTDGAVDIALLSSFMTRKLPQVRQRWPEAPQPFCDLYAFMQPDTEERSKLVDPAAPWNTAVGRMAQWCDRQDIISDWADALCEQFHARNLPIVSVASFIPEVTADRDSERGETARRALRFLIALVTQLIHRDQPVRTVELVAGTCIDGIWPGRSRNKSAIRYYANRMDDEEACMRLVATLKDVLQETDVGAGDKRIGLALELEPGPLYCLHHWESLKMVCESIAEDPVLSQAVGINLDISHYQLAGIEWEWVWDTPLVLDRIIHAHIAGHHRCGHLGDLPLLDLNRSQDYAPWLRMLKKISGRPPASHRPKFSGYVSLELEAAKAHSPVCQSLQELKSMLCTL